MVYAMYILTHVGPILFMLWREHTLSTVPVHWALCIDYPVNLWDNQIHLDFWVNFPVPWLSVWEGHIWATAILLAELFITRSVTHFHTIGH